MGSHQTRTDLGRKFGVVDVVSTRNQEGTSWKLVYQSLDLTMPAGRRRSYGWAPPWPHSARSSP
ncbi:hypothetical protein ABZZ17_20215 [Streptomyces sp. NPDC006512]|uniref:hypothetical protein n=1 Tax=Streptomyces sp. NPDC006512 TaxID=3154307 RepID=UPI0033A0D385